MSILYNFGQYGQNLRGPRSLFGVTDCLAVGVPVKLNTVHFWPVRLQSRPWNCNFNTLPILISFAFAIWLSLSHAQNPICHSWNSSPIKGDLVSCNPSANASACCYIPNICYSNGLCAPSPSEGTYFTPLFYQGCTDPTFSDPACFRECLNKTGNGIQSCEAQEQGTYCCYGYTGCNCADPKQVFTLGVLSILTSLSPTATNSVSSTREETSITSSGSSSIITSSSPSASSTATTSSPTSAILNQSTSSISSSIPPSTNTDPPASKNDSVPIGVGVGVGVPAVIAFGALLWFLGRRSQKEKALRADTAVHPKPLVVTELEHDNWIREVDGTSTAWRDPVEMPGR